MLFDMPLKGAPQKKSKVLGMEIIARSVGKAPFFQAFFKKCTSGCFFLSFFTGNESPHPSRLSWEELLFGNGWSHLNVLYHGGW